MGLRTCGSYRRTKSPFLRRSTTVSGSFQTSRSLNHFSNSASVFKEAARNACADGAVNTHETFLYYKLNW